MAPKVELSYKDNYRQGTAVGGCATNLTMLILFCLFCASLNMIIDAPNLWCYL